MKNIGINFKTNGKNLNANVKSRKKSNNNLSKGNSAQGPVSSERDLRKKNPIESNHKKKFILI